MYDHVIYNLDIGVQLRTKVLITTDTGGRAWLQGLVLSLSSA